MNPCAFASNASRFISPSSFHKISYISIEEEDDKFSPSSLLLFALLLFLLLLPLFVVVVVPKFSCDALRCIKYCANVFKCLLRCFPPLLLPLVVVVVVILSFSSLLILLNPTNCVASISASTTANINLLLSFTLTKPGTKLTLDDDGPPLLLFSSSLTTMFTMPSCSPLPRTSSSKSSSSSSS